jgi:hypothetical protein
MPPPDIGAYSLPPHCFERRRSGHRLRTKNDSFATGESGLAVAPTRPAGAGTAGKLRRIHAETLSFFSASRTCSIDFGAFGPMFRLNAALDRNAIPWFAARQRKSEPPAS